MKLTRERIESVLNDIVKDNEDFVYSGPDSMTCYYTHPDGSVGCIFGRAFDVLGLNRPAWGTDENTFGIAATLQALGVVVDEPKTVDFMYHVQELQDTGLAWGEAVKEAKELVDGSE